MRIDKLWIKEFKNLKDFKIDFDESQMTTILIGRNGTGKSNLIEAIVIIFRDLDLGNPPAFSYNLTYICKERKIRIVADAEKKSDHSMITIDNERISFSKFSKDNERKYLPRYIFAYYSGLSNRLENHFKVHQNKFYDDLLNNIEKPMRPLFYARLIHSQFVLLSYFCFDNKESDEFLEEYLGISGLESILFILKEPDWKKDKKSNNFSDNSGDKRFWNAKGVVQGVSKNI